MENLVLWRHFISGIYNRHNRMAVMPDSVFDVFPAVFCIEDIRCVRGDGGTYDCHATIYHDRASIAVVFNAIERSAQLRRGRFVSVDWPQG
jgi:hypothetical protein